MISLILFYTLLAICTEFEEFEYFGKNIKVFEEKKSVLSSTNSWYFVNMRNFFSNNDYHNMELEITQNNIITPDWYRLYLTPKQAYEIHSQYDCMMKPFDEDDKNLDINFTKNLFYAEFHPSFVPYETSKTKFKLLYRTIYEVSTTEVYKILEIPELLFICNSPENHFHNRWAGGFTQHNGAPRMTADGFQTPKYLKEHGISGQGQVVTVVDGGLDVNNSFFYDKDHPFVFDELNENHRKIIYYDSYGNQKDSQNEGHGTHVAGTVAGKSSCGNSNSLYDGVAPDARIHFIDIGKDDESRKLLNLPITILSTEMGYTNSYISSNSWGSGSRNYGQTKLYDMAAYYMKDRLFVFSSGNNGDKGFYTINSPGDAKNVLTVGATEQAYGQKFDHTKKHTIKLVVEDKNGNSRSFDVNHVSGPEPFTTTKGIYKSKTSKSPQSDAVFITSNPNSVCSLSPPPIAAIIASGKSPSCSPSDYAVYKSDGDTNFILEASSVTIELTISSPYYTPSIASFSSRGPSYFGINKPDVVAPGDEIKSATSRPQDTEPGHSCGNNDDDFSVKSGTSMSCPNIGGLATLVNQYFVDGYYPTGIKESKNSFIPGSTLIRALIVGSAEKVGESWTPDSIHGHGIPSIDNVLTFDRNLKVLKDVEIHQNEDKFFSFTMSRQNGNGRHLRISMAYLDEPDESDSAILQIDIDMHMITPSGKIIYGNMKQGNREEHLSTIEKIVIENNEIEEGTYELHFYGGGRISQTMKSKAEFSLCIAGPLSGSSLYDIESHDETAVEWQSKERKEDTCEFPKTGLNCQLSAVEVSNYSSIDLLPSSESFLYFYVPVNWSNVTIIINKPRETQSRLVYQFSTDTIYRSSYFYEKTISSDEPVYHIPLKPTDFRNPDHEFIGARINNLSPHSFPIVLQFVYDEFVPPVPTATTVPPTWKTSYVVGVAAGYGLLGLSVFTSIFFGVVYYYKYKEFKRLQTKYMTAPETSSNEQNVSV